MNTFFSYLYEFFKKNSTTLAIIVGTICFLVLIYVKMGYVFSFYPDISGAENSTILPLQRFILGLSIYSDPEKIPFLITPYTPLYYVIVGSLYKILGFDPENIHKIYALSRFMSLCFVLLACVSMSLTMRLLQFTKRYIWLATLLVFHVLAYWQLTSSRQDSLLFLLFTLFFHFAVKSILYNDKVNKYSYLAIIIAVIAFFGKQSGMVYPIIFGLYFLYKREFTTFIKITFTGTITFIVFSFLCSNVDLISFFRNIVGGLMNTISLEWWYYYTFVHLLYPLAIPIVLSGLIALKWLTSKSSNSEIFLSISLITLLFFNLSISLKVGAAIGYFSDYIYISILVIFYYFTQHSLSAFQRAFMAGICVCVFVQFSVEKAWGLKKFNNEGDFSQVYALEWQVKQFMNDSLKLSKKDFVYLGRMNKPYGGYYLNYFLQKNNLVPLNETITLTKRQGVYNYDNFDKLVYNGQLTYIICEKGVPKNKIFIPPFEHLNDKHQYQLLTSVEGFDIYKWNK